MQSFSFTDTVVIHLTNFNWQQCDSQDFARLNHILGVLGGMAVDELAVYE